MSKLTIRHPITFIIFLCDIYILFTMLKQLTDKIIKHKKLNVKLFFKKFSFFLKSLFSIVSPSDFQYLLGVSELISFSIIKHKKLNVKLFFYFFSFIDKYI